MNKFVLPDIGTCRNKYVNGETLSAAEELSLTVQSPRYRELIEKTINDVLENDTRIIQLEKIRQLLL